MRVKRKKEIQKTEEIPKWGYVLPKGEYRLGPLRKRKKLIFLALAVNTLVMVCTLHLKRLLRIPFSFLFSLFLLIRGACEVALEIPGIKL